MFDNVGSKCMKLAKFVCWLGIVLSVLTAVIMIIVGASSGSSPEGMTMLVYGIFLLIAGPLCSWPSSLGLYAIGEAAENSAIAANLAVKADMEREKKEAGD